MILVDPNFSPDTTRWRRPLVGLFKSANRGRALARCEYHLKAKATEEHFRSALGDQLAPPLPEGSCVTFFRWAQWPAKDGQPVGEDLHPRFVLTEFGGVRVNFGLDEG